VPCHDTPGTSLLPDALSCHNSGVPSARRSANGRKPSPNCAPTARFYRVATPLGGGPHALLCQQSVAGEPGGVVGQDVRAVGIGVDQARGRGCRPLCLRQQRSAGGGWGRHRPPLPAADELLHLSFTSLPLAHGGATRAVAARPKIRGPPGARYVQLSDTWPWLRRACPQPR
jgi:hypothetical protein